LIATDSVGCDTKQASAALAEVALARHGDDVFEFG
jgi:hypothetical protein